MNYISPRIAKAEEHLHNMQAAHAEACKKYNETQSAIHLAIRENFAKSVLIAQDMLLVERARNW